ncbi:MAG: ferritin-like domain-containing protein, partial [Bacteroides sp.]|nr:ferritin-like domain-containing protein [Bacteroides sp.]
VNDVYDLWISLKRNLKDNRAVFEQVYEHECRVSKMIDELVDVASAEKDKATQDFLWGFVREQVEEEATASGIVDMLKRAGETGVYYVDSKLGERK